MSKSKTSGMSMKLWEAWKNQEFTMHYQPQINMKTGSVEKFEALIRWSWEGEPVSPEVFIPIAEQIGLIGPLGMWVLRTVCEQIKLWEAEDPDFCGVSINFSAFQLQEPDIVRNIMRVIRETDVDPGKLEIELTERIFANHRGTIIAVFDELRKLGISIAIDDFGTGYASLSSLQYIPFDTIKIDRSFIKNLHSNFKSREITKAIINLAHQLQVRVVAEGVEFHHQMDFLKHERCDSIQGYLLSRPVVADEAYKLYILNK